MKKIISLVLGLTAVALAAGCSDDSSSDSSCNVPLNGANFVCVTGSVTGSDCTDKLGGTVVDSCPSGSISSCTASGSSGSGTYVFYTDTAVTTMGGVCANPPTTSTDTGTGTGTGTGTTGNVSCNIQSGSANFACITAPMAASDCTTNGGAIVNSCPTGSVSSCPITAGSDSGTLYFYSDAAAASLTSMCDA